MRLIQLGPSHTDLAMAFCARNPVATVFVAGWVHGGGLARSDQVPEAWLLAELDADERISGLAYLSTTGILLPVAISPRAVDELVSLTRSSPGLVRVLVGERDLVAAAWRAFAGLGLVARIVKDQLAFEVDGRSFRPVEPPLPLAVATSADLDDLVHASGAMAREESGDDPERRNPPLFAARIRDRVERGRDFVFREGGALAFKANVASWSRVGGQIEGVYTAPRFRRRGIATRGVSTVTAWVLDRATRAVLLVNEDNAEARRLYTRLGYEPRYPSRTILIDGPRENPSFG